MTPATRARLLRLVDQAAAIEARVRELLDQTDSMRAQLDDVSRRLSAAQWMDRTARTGKAAVRDHSAAQVEALEAQRARVAAELERIYGDTHAASRDAQVALTPVRALIAAAATENRVTPHGEPLQDARCDELRQIVLSEPDTTEAGA